MIAAAGAVGAAVALVYVIGGASLSIRYDGFGLPGNQAAAQSPREVLLAAGLRTLVIWTLVGIAFVLLLRRLPDAIPRALARGLGRPTRMLAAAAVALALLLVLRVWWPLAAYAALLAVLLLSVGRKDDRLTRLFASAAVVTLVAVAYEADRLTYGVERTCVTPARETQSTEATEPTVDSPICGTLVGHQERGFYLGVPIAAPGRHSAPQELVFVPADQVLQAASRKQLLRVTRTYAERRRERLISRLWNLRVR